MLVQHEQRSSEEDGDMRMHYFPRDDPDSPGIVSYSTPYRAFCPQRLVRGVSPLENLQLAKAQLHRGGRDGLVNALSNARRCLFHQVDTLLHAMGLRQATSRVTFSVKLGLLQDLRLVSLGMLRLYALVRHAMEYDRITPTREMAQRAIDLCEVFLPATECYLTQTPACVRVVLADDDRDLLFLLDPDAGMIRKLHVIGSSPQETRHGRYYDPSLFDQSGSSVRDGLSLTASLAEDTRMQLETRQSWLPILRIFGAAVRPPQPGHARHPDEPLVKFEVFEPSSAAKDAIENALARNH